MEGPGALHPYGTALPSLDEDTTFKEKPARVEDQIVTDENGRRRFHGAFTGGFSAGYWNTVGSQEGWTPQSFKSSRAEKAIRMQQKPVDFMDDEDLGEFGIAPQRLQVREEYGGASGESRKRKLQLPSGFGDGSSDVLNNIFQPVKTTVGVKILKSMGWRPGQGIGARQTKKEKKQAAAYNKREMYVLQHYGCTTSSKTDEVDNENEKDDVGSTDDDIDEEITFAPDDYDAYDYYLYKPKENYFGLGYSGLSRDSILSDGKAGPAQHINLFGPLEILGKDNKKLSITGQAFGVGALEEEDDDIYQREDMSKYDFSLENKKDKKGKRQIKTGESIQDSFVLEGFIAETKCHKNVEQIYDVELPKNWTPRNWAERKSRFSPLDEKQLRALEKRRHQLSKPALTPKERSNILEAKETKTPVEEEKLNLEKVKEKFTKREDRTKELLERISEKSSGFVRGGIIAIDGTEKDNKELTKSSLDVAAKEGGSFQPFAYDESKQKRYDDFIAANISTEQDISEFLNSIQPLHHSEWDREMEKKEFIQAKKLYKPLEGLMANRFISETTVKAEAPVKETKKTEDRSVVIAVRTKTVWKPASLLCKRYNIAEPFGGTGGTDEKQQKQKNAKLSVFDYLEGSVNTKANFITPVVIPKHIDNTKEIIKNAIESKNQNFPNTSKNDEINEPSTSAMATIKESIGINNEIVEPGTLNDAIRRLTFVPKTELEKRVVETRDLPIEEKRDIFKSIFADSDDDNEDDKLQVEEMSNSNASEGEKQAIEGMMMNKIAPSAASVNLLRNTSPPRGIFAALFKTNEIEEDTSIAKDSTKDDYEPPPKIKFMSKEQRHDDGSILNVDSNKEMVCENVYGPAIPTSLLKSQSSKEMLNDTHYKSTENRVLYKGVEIVEEWVEKIHESSMDSDDSSSSSSSSKKKQKKSKKSKKTKKSSIKKSKKSKKKKGRKEKAHKSAKSKKR